MEFQFSFLTLKIISDLFSTEKAGGMINVSAKKIRKIFNVLEIFIVRNYYITFNETMFIDFGSTANLRSAAIPTIHTISLFEHTINTFSFSNLLSFLSIKKSLNFSRLAAAASRSTGAGVCQP